LVGSVYKSFSLTYLLTYLGYVQYVAWQRRGRWYEIDGYRCRDGRRHKV